MESTKNTDETLPEFQHGRLAAVPERPDFAAAVRPDETDRHGKIRRQAAVRFPGQEPAGAIIPVKRNAKVFILKVFHAVPGVIVKIKAAVRPGEDHQLIRGRIQFRGAAGAGGIRSARSVTCTGS